MGNSALTETSKPSVTIKSFTVFRTYSNDGGYRGQVTLTNNESEEFTFKLDDEATKKVLACIADRVSESADTFADKIRNLSS